MVGQVNGMYTGDSRSVPDCLRSGGHHGARNGKCRRSGKARRFSHPADHGLGFIGARTLGFIGARTLGFIGFIGAHSLGFIGFIGTHSRSQAYSHTGSDNQQPE